jgi:hypothetical protein
VLVREAMEGSACPCETLLGAGDRWWWETDSMLVHGSDCQMPCTCSRASSVAEVRRVSGGRDAAVKDAGQ